LEKREGAIFFIKPSRVSCDEFDDAENFRRNTLGKAEEEGRGKPALRSPIRLCTKRAATETLRKLFSIPFEASLMCGKFFIGRFNYIKEHGG
jgi:hypothetical protein